MATTVLCLGACSTGLVAKTAAVPQIALPDEISNARLCQAFFASVQEHYPIALCHKQQCNCNSFGHPSQIADCEL